MKGDVIALYRGDEFIDVGTRDELAERHGVKPDTISYLASPAYKRNCEGHEDKRLMAYRVGRG